MTSVCFQCLMPQTLTPQTEGVSEEALRERIHLRMVKESVDMFDQLLQAGMWSPARFCAGALLKLGQKYFSSCHRLWRQFCDSVASFTTDYGLMKWNSLEFLENLGHCLSDMSLW